MTAPDLSELAAALRRLGDSARLEGCPGRELSDYLERPGRRGPRAALERHLIDCAGCGALIAAAVRSAPAEDLAPSPTCAAIVRRALSQPARTAAHWRWTLGWGLSAALAAAVLAPELRRLLLEASMRSIGSAAVVTPSPLRLGPEDRPGGDTLRAGPAAPLTSPDLERAEVWLRAAELVGSDRIVVALLQARVELLRGAPRRAVAILLPLVRTHPREARAHAHLAAARLHLGQRAAARAAAARAHELMPLASWALYDLALLSEPADGAALFARALALERDPSWRRQIVRARAALAP